VAILLRDQARVQLARSIYRDIYSNFDYYYLYIGKTTAWADESNPDIPVDNLVNISEQRRNILFYKRVQTSDCVLLTRRIDWESATVYDEYDNSYSSANPANSGATTLSNANFYVMTDSFNVYKCIENNKNSQSTVKPTSTGTEIFELSDGYKWKFMFQIGAADRTKFLTDDYIPVRKVSGAGYPAFDINGEIDEVIVTSGGSGYTAVPTVTIQGDGQGASANATVSAGAVTDVTVSTEGIGYSFAQAVFTGGGGTGAEATVSLGSTDSATLQSSVETTAVPGTIDRITVTSSGIDYADGDVAIEIDGDGTGAEASATLNNRGEITGVAITAPGQGYTFADVSITQINGIGSGATFRAVISPVYGHGSNPQHELFAKNLGITVSFVNDNKDYILDNDFRQVGIVKNIYQEGTTNLFTDNLGTPCHVIGVSNPDEYNYDDILTTTENGKFMVVHKSDTNNDGTYDEIYLQQIKGGISASSIIENLTTGTEGLTINSVVSPEIDNISGEIIYFDNRRPVIRDEDQTETVKVIFTF